MEKEGKLIKEIGFILEKGSDFYLGMFFHVLFEVQKGIEMLLLKCYY